MEWIPRIGKAITLTMIASDYSNCFSLMLNSDGFILKLQLKHYLDRYYTFDSFGDGNNVKQENNYAVKSQNYASTA